MPRRLGGLGERDDEERVGDGWELSRGDVEGGALVRQRPRADDDDTDAHVVLNRPARADADDRANADLDELVDDDAHRWRAHPARCAHDRGAAGQRGGEGVEAAVPRQLTHRAEMFGGDQLGAGRIAAEQGDRRAVVEIIGPEPQVIQRPAVMPARLSRSEGLRLNLGRSVSVGTKGATKRLLRIRARCMVMHLPRVRGRRLGSVSPDGGMCLVSSPMLRSAAGAAAAMHGCARS